MKLLRESKKGFTLLELILALGIVGFIVVISLGAIRLGTSAQETGHLKVDTFQRLRLIENQLAQKIKSTYPVFVLPEESVFISKEFKKIPKRLLAFEGTSDSIRFVTFSAIDSSTKYISIKIEGNYFGIPCFIPFSLLFCFLLLF